MSGSKHDEGKPDMTLLTMLPALVAVVRVLEYGAQKYGRDNWQRVEDGERRYCAAALRHLLAHAYGERLDPESGLPHLAHAACSVLFALNGGP